MGNEIFISYAKEDSDWKTRVEGSLSMLDKYGCWSDTEIGTGDQWHPAIKEAITNAKVAVLLVSPSFLRSDYILQHELPVIATRWTSSNSGLKVFPLVVHQTDFDALPPGAELLSNLQRRPTGPRGLEDLPPRKWRDELSRLLDEIEETLDVDEGTVAQIPPSPPVVVDRQLSIELGFRHFSRGRYRVEVACSDPNDRLGAMPRQFTYVAQLVREELFNEASDVNAYQRLLIESLFPSQVLHPIAYKRFSEILARIEKESIPARLQLSIDVTSADLNYIHWETLAFQARFPGVDGPINLQVTRYVSAGNEPWPAPEVRSKPTIIVHPVSLGGPNDSLVRSNLDKTTAFLAERQINVAKVSSNNFLSPLSDIDASIIIFGLDLDLESDEHDPTIRCEDGRGRTCFKRASELAEKLSLERLKPQILVLDYPEHDKVSASRAEIRLVSIASEIIKSGVCATLAPQAPMEREQWLGFVAGFIESLSDTKNISGAIQLAQSQLSDINERWRPVLLSRLRTGDIWNKPGFVSIPVDQQRAKWGILVDQIQRGDCVPVIGPDVSRYFYNGRSAVAAAWAEECAYPLSSDDKRTLRKVAQYVATMKGNNPARNDFIRVVLDFANRTIRPRDVVNDIGSLCAEAWSQIKHADQFDPYSVIAQFEAPVYLTTTYHNVLSKAVEDHLQQQGITYVARERFFFNRSGAMSAIESESERASKINSQNPIVYYLFGRVDEPRSLVLTEDDHFEFLLDFDENWRSVRNDVRTKIASSSLLFLGFSLESWDFRALAQALIQNKRGRQAMLDNPHVAVQVNPDQDRFRDPEATKRYLINYFSRVTNDPFVYIGSVEDFLHELSTHLPKAGNYAGVAG